MSVTQRAFNDAAFNAEITVPNGLIGPDGKQAGKRFDVYRNNVAVGLSDALEVAFPVLRRLLGDRFFRAMAGVYQRLHPPKSPLMMHYGAQMPAFLREFLPVSHLPYLPDIARVEMARRQCYHAADSVPIDPATLGDVAADQLPFARFRFAPAIQHIQSDYPIVQIWSANVTPDASTLWDKKSTNILVTRPDFDLVLHPLVPDTSRALEALLQGQTLGESVMAGGETCDFTSLLRLLLAQRAIVAIY